MRRTDELDDLLGAYALDAVDIDERYLVEQYLAADPRARAEVQQHREVATMLAFSGAPAPEGLWDRIAGALDDHAPVPGPELAKVLPIDSFTRSERRAPRPRGGRWLVVAGGAAAAVLVGVLGVLVVERGREIDRLRPQAVQTALSQGYGNAMADPLAAKVSLASTDGETSVQAAVEPDGVGYLAAGDLPELPDGRTYQLWGVVDGKVISLGVLGNRPDIMAFTVGDGDLTALVITEEESGGVPVSQNPPALVGELS
jgi:anti-sigma factor RsiW